MKASTQRPTTAAPSEPRAKDLPRVISSRVIQEIVECAAWTPKSQRALLADILAGIADVLADRPSKPTRPDVNKLDIRIRTALQTVIVGIADLFTGYVPHLSRLIGAAAAMVRDGEIAVGLRKIPQPVRARAA